MWLFDDVVVVHSTIRAYVNARWIPLRSKQMAKIAQWASS